VEENNCIYSATKVILNIDFVKQSREMDANNNCHILFDSRIACYYAYLSNPISRRMPPQPWTRAFSSWARNVVQLLPSDEVRSILAEGSHPVDYAPWIILKIIQKRQGRQN